MVDHRAYDSERYRKNAVRSPLHAAAPLAVTSRLFATGLLLAGCGTFAWLTGFGAASWGWKMVGTCLLSIGCLIATGALLRAEQILSDDQKAG